MGTILEITLSNDNAVKEALEVIKKTANSIDLTTQKINSAKINYQVALNKDFQYLLQKADYYHKISKGRFDITTATIAEKYGFPSGPFKIPNDKILENALKNYGWKNLISNEKYVFKKTDLKINTGAYAKGYIVDKAVEYLKSKNISSGLINAGGDLYALGSKNGKNWKIAIQNPMSKEKYLSIVNLKDKALATSGNYERFFEKDGKRIIHIFDGKTGMTANNYQSVSVIANSTETADGLATVYFLSNINEIKNLCKKYKTPVLIYTLDNKLLKLCNWKQYE